MSVFSFKAAQKPFARWMGPFSPARGTRSGFRVRRRQLGTWVAEEFDKEFWRARNSRGVTVLANLVTEDWGGGRVLLLPNGFVVKPLQEDDEVGIRVLIGRFDGSLVLDQADGSAFDMGKPGPLRPGDLWPGPATTGLECAIQPDGALYCSWYHPTSLGRDESHERLRGADAVLAAGLMAARPGDADGRVRITARGHIITMRQDEDGAWRSIYVGHVAPNSWTGWERWIGKEHL